MPAFFHLLIFFITYSCSSQRKVILPSQQSCSYSDDSIKWKAYSLVYDVKLKKLIDEGERYIQKDDSLFNVVECEINIVETIEKGDTTEFLFKINRNNLTDKYVQLKSNSYVGVGYVKSVCVYYPIPGQSAFDVGLDYYAKFWQKQDDKFIGFLKEYKRNVNSWLMIEAKKRKILR